jgi:hypothetical protein
LRSTRVGRNGICAALDQCWQPYDGGLTERLVNCVLLLLKDGDSDVAVLAREVGFLPGNAHCPAVYTEAKTPIGVAGRDEFRHNTADE